MEASAIGSIIEISLWTVAILCLIGAATNGYKAKATGKPKYWKIAGAFASVLTTGIFFSLFLSYVVMRHYHPEVVHLSILAPLIASGLLLVCSIGVFATGKCKFWV